MPMRAPEGESVDPVRSRLAASAAAAPLPRTSAALAERREVPGQEGDGSELPAAGARHNSKADPNRFTVNRKVMFTEEEAERNADTVTMISAAFGSQATYSQITRALWSILSGAEEALRASGRRTRRLANPSKGDHIAMAEYEKALAQFLSSALRRS